MQKQKTKFKIFKGQFSSSSADEKANAWLDAHPEVSIVSFEYSEAHYGNHSICIEYIEDNLED